MEAEAETETETEIETETETGIETETLGGKAFGWCLEPFYVFRVLTHTMISKQLDHSIRVFAQSI